MNGTGLLHLSPTQIAFAWGPISFAMTMVRIIKDCRRGLPLVPTVLPLVIASERMWAWRSRNKVAKFINWLDCRGRYAPSQWQCGWSVIFQTVLLNNPLSSRANECERGDPEIKWKSLLIDWIASLRSQWQRGTLDCHVMAAPFLAMTRERTAKRHNNKKHP